MTMPIPRSMTRSYSLRTEQRTLAWRLSLRWRLGCAHPLPFLGNAQSGAERCRAACRWYCGGLGWLAGLHTAWRSLQYPDLHGITDQLIALAFIARGQAAIT